MFFGKLSKKSLNFPKKVKFDVIDKLKFMFYNKDNNVFILDINNLKGVKIDHVQWRALYF